MKKSDIMEMFKYNEFKLRILREKVTKEPTTSVQIWSTHCPV